MTSPCQVPPREETCWGSKTLSRAPCPHPPKWVTQSIPFCGLNTLSQKDSYRFLPRWCLLQPRLYLRSPSDPRELLYLLVKFSHEKSHWPHPDPELPSTPAISTLCHFLTSNGTHYDGLGFRSPPTVKEKTITHSSVWREEQSEYLSLIGNWKNKSNAISSTRQRKGEDTMQQINSFPTHQIILLLFVIVFFKICWPYSFIPFWPCYMWDVSSLIRDWTHALSSGSNFQGNPCLHFFLIKNSKLLSLSQWERMEETHFRSEPSWELAL